MRKKKLITRYYGKISRDVVEDIWVILKRKQSQMVELTDKHNFSELQQRSILIEIREQKHPHSLVQSSNTYISFIFFIPYFITFSIYQSLIFFSNMYITWKRVQLWHRSRNLLATQCFFSGKNKEKAKQTICFEINFNSYLHPSLDFIALKIQTLVTYSL